MIRDMKNKGMSNREIAMDLSISRNTVSKLLRTTRLTDHRKRKRGSKLDQYRDRIRVMCSLYYLDTYKREYIEIRRYKGESRGGFLKLLHTPGHMVI